MFVFPEKGHPMSYPLLGSACICCPMVRKPLVSALLFSQVLIPISLYVSIELVKIGQVFFLHNDLDLCDEEADWPIQCRALNITEDLGQIQYIFSDKTGTLTENKMVFRRCSIMGNEYCHQENGKKIPKNL